MGDNTPSADDVAAAILAAAPGIDQMQLHKLLYLVQAAGLSWFGTPAFNGTFQAWSYGPVVRGIAARYKDFDRQPIPRALAGDPSRLSAEATLAVEQIAKKYGRVKGPELAKYVKAPGSPWRQARGDIADDAWSQAEITEEMMRNYHRRYGVVPEVPTAREAALIDRFMGEHDRDALADLFKSITGVRPTVT